MPKKPLPFAQQLRADREAANLTREAAAEKLKAAGIQPCTASTLRGWEDGVREPPTTKPVTPSTQAEILAAMKAPQQ